MQLTQYLKKSTHILQEFQKSFWNLPKPIFNPTNNNQPIIVPMSSIQRRIYDNLANKIRNNINEFRGDVLALTQFRKKSIIYLIEASTDPSLLTKDMTDQSDEIDPTGLDMFELLEQYPRLKNESLNKLDMAVNLAKTTLDSNEKVIIWCSFIKTIEKLSKYFEDKGHKSVQIYGAIPRDDEVNEEFNREIEIEKFKNNSEYNILIANAASLAESISLHKHCHHAIYVDRTFNGGHYMQSLERIHRIGLDPLVKTRYDIIQSEHSIDQTIHTRLGIKKENIEKFFNQAELTSTHIDLNSNDFTYRENELEDDFKAVVDDMGIKMPKIFEINKLLSAVYDLTLEIQSIEELFVRRKYEEMYYHNEVSKFEDILTHSYELNLLINTNKQISLSKYGRIFIKYNDNS